MSHRRASPFYGVYPDDITLLAKIFSPHLGIEDLAATLSTKGILIWIPGPASRRNLPSRWTMAVEHCFTVKNMVATAENIVNINALKTSMVMRSNCMLSPFWVCVRAFFTG